jgi:RpiB/LacA/LacB family sugar-phosphate isomerase
MRVAIGSDHAGFSLKQELISLLKGSARQVLDLGTDNGDSVDYPGSAEAVARAVVENRADRGVLICGSGVGASIACNKIPGIRAAICHDTYSARQGVEHDDMNILVLGARVIGVELARELVRSFLSASFSKEERYRRRLRQVEALEERYSGGRKRSFKRRKS